MGGEDSHKAAWSQPALAHSGRIDRLRLGDR